MKLTPIQQEQLVSIVRNYPVWAGDLISKQAKKELVGMGLVKYKKGHGISRTSDGERLGGYVPTNKGFAVVAVIALEQNS